MFKGATLCTTVLSAGAGYLLCGFTEVLHAQSLAIPLACVGTLALNWWATNQLHGAEVACELDRQRELRRRVRR